MLQFGPTYGFSGFQQLPANQGSQATQPVATGAPVVAAYAAPVMPVALAPTFMAGQPYQMHGGAPAASSAAPTGGHVTANSTNSTVSDYRGGAAYGGAAYGGGAVYGGVMAGFAIPFMMTPIFVQFGQVYGPAPATVGDQPAPEPPPVVEPPPVDVVDEVPAPTGDVPPPADSVPDEPRPELPIQRFTADDFKRYGYQEKERSLKTSFEFELTTRDGDVITLDFEQLDTQGSLDFRGKTLDGQRVRDERYTEDTERAVKVDVTGALDDAEQAAIDKVIDAVISVAEKFFKGDMSGAVRTLKAMDFDSSELAELSLNLSMEASASYSRGYLKGADGVAGLKNRDAGVGQVLDFLATEQKRLVNMAKDVLDAPSAAKLVKTLLPPLLTQPFEELRSEVSLAAPEMVADSEPVAEGDDDERDDD